MPPSAIDRFAEMMIARMEQMKASDWKKGWIGSASILYRRTWEAATSRVPTPSSSQLQTAAQGYRLPVYLTFDRRTTSRPMY